MKLCRFSSCFIICIFMYGATHLIGMPGMEPGTMGTPSGGMPGISGEAKPKTLDKQITADLNSLSKHSSLSDRIRILNKILDYASNQTTSQQSQINYCNELKNLDTMAKSYSLTKIQINHLLKLFRQAQTSTLIYGGFVSNISNIIQYWENRFKTVGLSRYQRALQRKREAPRTRSFR